MACAREAAADGRVGTLPCDETDCLFGRVTLRGNQITIENTSQTDCVLQFRLRAGDSEGGSEGPRNPDRFAKDGSEFVFPLNVLREADKGPEESTDGEFDIDPNDYRFRADPGPHPEVFYIGTTYSKRQRPSHMEWSGPDYIDDSGHWIHRCVKNSDTYVYKVLFGCPRCGSRRPRRDNLGGRVLRDVRNSPPTDPMRWELFKELDGEMRSALYGEGESMEGQYPGSDTPQQWSRRGLSEHIRLELQVLGLIPGPDGMVRSPDTWSHICPGIPTLANKFITLKVGQPCAECGASENDRPRESRPRIWEHYCLFYKEVIATGGDVCAHCGTSRGEVGEPIKLDKPEYDYVEDEQGRDVNARGVAGERGDLSGRRPFIERKDKYNINIDGVNVVANERVEQRIRALTDDQLRNFRKIFGG